MASLDVDSLLTNIPLDKTIDICIDSLYKDDQNTPRISKDVFRYLVTVITQELFFMLNNKVYKQTDGVAMSTPTGSHLANIVMCHFENKLLKDCPQSLKAVFYIRYVDDIFVLVSSLDQAEKFKMCLSSKHPNKLFVRERK